MDRNVKVAVGAGLFVLGLTWLGAASAGEYRVEDAPDMTSAEQVVRLTTSARGMTLSAWVKSKVDRGLVVLAGPKGVAEDALLYSVDKARAKDAVASGYFRVVAGSVS